MYKLYYIIALNFLALAAYAQEPFWEIVEIPESIKRLGSIAINDSGHLFLGASPYDGKGGGVYRYKGDGYEWEHLGLGKSFICSMAISQSNDIFLGTNCWVIRSTDNGATWDTLKEMLTNFDDIEVTEDSMVFATTYYGLLRSFNYGDNWDLVFNDQIGDAWMSSVEVGPSKELYIGLRDYYDPIRGVYRSLDTGNTWEYIGPDKPIHSVETNQQGYIYAGCLYHGFYRKNDSITKWELLIPNITVDDILIQYYGHIYLAAKGYGMLLYDEVTHTYSSKNSGLQDHFYITALGVDPDGYLYCVNYHNNYSELYKSTTSIITEINNVETKKYVSVTCYPNPFSSGSTIRINYPNDEIPAESQLKLISSGGKLVKKIHLKNTNRYYLKGDIPAGIYYVIIESGNYKGYHKIIKIN